LARHLAIGVAVDIDRIVVEDAELPINTLALSNCAVE
jgi:hypothetical protein